MTPVSLVNVRYNLSTSRAIIGYTLRDAARVTMTIADQRGRLVARLVDGVVFAGNHEAVWDARRAPAGVYVCKVAVDGMAGWTGKVVVAK